MSKMEILVRYNKNADMSNEDDFLDYAYKVMFNSYITKTFMETKKKYIINSLEYKNAFLLYEDISSLEKGIEMETFGDDSASLIDNVDDSQLYKYLQKLSTKQRKVIIEYYVNNKSEKEIGYMLGISKQAVNSLRKRALNAKIE